MAHEYVRICPVCEAENAPSLARCRCGASLAAVDFSLKRPAAEAAEVSAAPAPPEPESTVEEAPANAVASAPVAPAQIAASAPVICPHPDCGQPNPPGAERCVYCNRRLAPPALSAEPSPATETEPDDAATPAPEVITGARALPRALREHYRVVHAFPVSGSEADIMLVEDVRTQERRIAKLYRMGLEPDFRLLTILSQTVGDSVVRVLGHGISDGVAYEILEYIPGGTLAELLEAGPLPIEDVRRMVAEIADALKGIHAHHILHRDLKPDNVLLRSKSPLELALTDFGIASLSEATQRFTSVARTTRYAAPEALTGVIDAKSDWWSLGMIALEAATGRHPFDGLTEHVMNHHLATRPIDVRGVYDDPLRLLCRGLLLRDPNRRWGADEVARWLAGDPTLDVSDDADGTPSAVQPYRIGTNECTTASDLALALAKNWDTARKDLARGQIGNWVENELHDYNLTRKLRDIQDDTSAGEDLRLLRFLLAAAPDLPPVWQGLPLSAALILDAALRGSNGESAAVAWLAGIAQNDVLVQFADADLREIGERWEEAWTRFMALWNGARAGEAAWRRKPKPVAGIASATVVSYDDVMYGAQLRLALPERRSVNAALLVALADPAYVEGLRGEVAAALADITGYCPWYDALWEDAREDPIGIVVMHRLIRHARDDAASEKDRLGASDAARERIVAEARRDIREKLATVFEIAPDETLHLGPNAVSNLLEALEPLIQACAKAAALGNSQPDYEALRIAAEKLSGQSLVLQQALAQCEAEQGVNALFLQPVRILIPIIFTLFAAARSPWLGLGLVVTAALFAAYRAHATFRARDRVRSRLRALLRSAAAFTREHPRPSQAEPRSS